MNNRLHGLAIALAISTLLGACSGGGSSSSANVTPTPPTPPAPPTPGITLLAGTLGGVGNIDGNGAAARFNYPNDFAADQAGNIYIADKENFTVRKVTPAGVVTTLAGKAGSYGSIDGDANTARLGRIEGLAVDVGGNVYVSESETIRRITPAGQVSTVAGMAGELGNVDGTGKAARLSSPNGLAFDAAGNLYASDILTRTIRRISAAGVVTTFAGKPYGKCTYMSHFPDCVAVDGKANEATFIRPTGLAIDGAGNVYVDDAKDIRKISANGTVSTLTINSANVTITKRVGLTIDGSGNLYTIDASGQYRLLKISPTGELTVVPSASLNDFDYLYNRLSITPSGNFIISAYNGVIATMTPGSNLLTLAGTAAKTGTTDGKGEAARFDMAQPPRDEQSTSSAALDAAGNLYVADSNNRSIRKISAAGEVTTLAGSKGRYSVKDGVGSDAGFDALRGIVVDASGNLFVADRNLVRKVTPDGRVTTIAGNEGKSGDTDGVGSAASFNELHGISLDSQGNILVTTNAAIRKIAPDLRVSTIAGAAPGSSIEAALGSNDGSANLARFSSPHGIVTDTVGNIYVADSKNHTIRKITAAGAVSTLAGVAGQAGATDGTGSAARFDTPIGLGIDAQGNLFVTDNGNHTVRQISPDGRVSTVAGQAGKIGVTLGSLPGTLATPTALAVGSKGLLYVITANGVVKIQL